LLASRFKDSYQREVQNCRWIFIAFFLTLLAKPALVVLNPKYIASPDVQAFFKKGKWNTK
jgi:hypothetical protein